MPLMVLMELSVANDMVLGSRDELEQASTNHNINLKLLLWEDQAEHR